MVYSHGTDKKTSSKIVQKLVENYGKFVQLPIDAKAAQINEQNSFSSIDFF